MAFFQLKEIFVCYSIVAILICPFKTWLIILMGFLIYKCKCLNENDFKSFLQYKGSNANTASECPLLDESNSAAKYS